MGRGRRCGSAGEAQADWVKAIARARTAIPKVTGQCCRRGNVPVPPSWRSTNPQQRGDAIDDADATGSPTPEAPPNPPAARGQRDERILDVLNDTDGVVPKGPHYANWAATVLVLPRYNQTACRGCWSLLSYLAASPSFI